MKLLLVDDHKILRDGLQTLLESDPSMEVVASVGSADEALQTVREHEVEVAIVDLSLPGRNGLWLVRQLRKVRPHISVLMLSMHTDADSVAQALSEGANGYLTKSADREELFQAIIAVSRGRTYVQERLAPSVMQAIQSGRRLEPQEELSEREVEVLKLVARGDSNHAIAEAMSVSLSSVKSYLRSCFKKFGVTTRTELVVTALNQGILLQDEI